MEPPSPPLAPNPLPVEIVFHPSWWFDQAGITFDEDFFYHPLRRVEVERTMESVLHERFGRFGLGADRDRDLPVIGPVHNAAGFLISEMLGCSVEYRADAPPLVVPAQRDLLSIDLEGAFQSSAWRRFRRLTEALRARHGYLVGDVNWGGVLNIALDLRGQDLFLDFFDRPADTQAGLSRIYQVLDHFTREISSLTGTTSITVNRTVRHLRRPVFLHSECSHTMISVEQYEAFLWHFDAAWSRERRPFGIHYCGPDPHRYAPSFAKLPHLDFLDVGWGGDVKRLREALPATFLNLRLDPVSLVRDSVETIRENVLRLVTASGDPYLTGLCSINIDHQVGDEKIAAIFEAAADWRGRSQREPS
ncbi:MAG: hypothetical protein AB1486_00460 [Planctomycetota bacterium]